MVCLLVIRYFNFFSLSARCRFDAVSIGDIVYFAGGMCNDPHQNTLEMYCPSTTAESVQLPAPKLPRYDHCTTVLDGKIYFIGGKSNDVYNSKLTLSAIYNTRGCLIPNIQLESTLKFY